MADGLRLLARIGIDPSTIVDVGASDGRWSRLARAVFPTADLVLFEPQPVHAPALEAFQADNSDATILRSAVGETEGSTLFDAADPFGGVLQRTRTADSIDVPLISLDAALIAAKPPFLVKLDTHGVETAILAGAKQTLGNSVAWIIEAYNQRFAPGCPLFWELCAQMAEYGFRPVDLLGVLHRPHDGTLWQMDLLFLRSGWDGFSYLNYT